MDILKYVDSDTDPSEDGCGFLEPQKLIHAILEQRHIIETIPELDAARAWEVDSEVGRATVIHCGRMKGWWDRRLSQLLIIAEAARDNEGIVMWY